MPMPAIRDPLATVYITNHNYGAYIEQAIESVLKQTLQDVELIIIDDGSTDNSREIIERYATHERVVAIFQHNKGLTVSNNIALRAARGRYIMRLDADDYLDENALAVLSGVLERNPDIGMVFPDYFLINDDSTVREVVRRHAFDTVTLLDQPAHGACTLIRRTCLLEVAGYDESIRCQDGYDLWLRFVGRYRVQNVNLPLFYYRQHAGSLSKDDESLLRTRERILRRRAAVAGGGLSAVAIIPIRGRSAGQRSEAMQLLDGRPLIDWSLTAALEAHRVQDVIVTTPDEEVLAHVRAKQNPRIVPIERDRRLAMPNTDIEGTLLHALGLYAREHTAPDVVAVLYIESPFRRGRHVDAAIDVMELFDTDSVIGVRPETDEFYQHDGNGLNPLRAGRLLRLERDEIYRRAGQLYVVRRTFLETHNEVVGGRVGHVVVSQEAAWRIRNGWEWRIAEFLASSSGTAPTPAAPPAVRQSRSAERE